MNERTYYSICSYPSFLLCLFIASPSQMYWLKDVSLTNISEKGCIMKWNKERREENRQRRRRRCRSFPSSILLCVFLLPLLKVASWTGFFKGLQNVHHTFWKLLKSHEQQPLTLLLSSDCARLPTDQWAHGTGLHHS